MAVPVTADRLDVSDPTVYRPIDPLVDLNLLEERRRIDENGTQHEDYRTILEEVTFATEDGSYTVDIRVDQDLADHFESLRSPAEPEPCYRS